VLHLFDSFGVTLKPVQGIGERKDNSIRFKFDYTVGPWFNTFTWEPGRKSWKNMITFERKDGSEGTFAEKELIPIRFNEMRRVPRKNGAGPEVGGRVSYVTISTRN